jgi:hypothetical protein
MPDGLAKRRQVPPFVRLVERIFVVGGVARVHLRAMPGEQRSQSLVDEGGVGHARPDAAGAFEEICVHGGVQPCAPHAITMPRKRTVSGTASGRTVSFAELTSNAAEGDQG